MRLAEGHSWCIGENNSPKASQNEKVNFSMRMICSLVTVVKVAAVCLFVGFVVGTFFMISVI
ncbi:hypothetical protein [Lentzea sp.]|uniref:hypothetical protein n=1 Tax=Lentzea sp. TaxID=56099 RepID=UPI002CE8C178|nr:hypothetical protein [Lentzea sp.]HUQ55207.1 hypothetical protein [Lentzea sp.]